MSKKAAISILETLQFVLGIADMEPETNTITWNHEPIGPCPKGYWGSHFVYFVIGFVFFSLFMYSVILPPYQNGVEKILGALSAIGFGTMVGFLFALVGPMIMTPINWISYEFRKWFRV